MSRFTHGFKNVPGGSFLFGKRPEGSPPKTVCMDALGYLGNGDHCDQNESRIQICANIYTLSHLRKRLRLQSWAKFSKKHHGMTYHSFLDEYAKIPRIVGSRMCGKFFGKSRKSGKRRTTVSSLSEWNSKWWDRFGFGELLSNRIR